MKNKILVAGAAVLAGLSGGVLAQAQQDAGALMREQEQQEQRPTPEPELPAFQHDRLTTPLPIEESGTTIEIAALRLTGRIDLLSEEEAQAVTDLAVGRRLGIQGLKALAERITIHLQQQGHLLAFALLPPQDVSQGDVRVEIREGSLESVDIRRSERVRMKDHLLRAIGEKPLGDAATRGALEEALLRLNDLPGISARGYLEAGEAANTSRLNVAVNEAPLFDFSVHGNNYGVTATGEYQTLASLSLSDASGYGDSSSLALSHAKGQTYAAASSSLPLGATGAYARMRYSKLDYEHVDGSGEIVELEGTASLASLGADYNLIRSRDFNLRLSADFQHKTLEDNSAVGNVSEKEIDAWQVGFGGDHRDGLGGGGVTGFSLTVTAGDLDLSGNTFNKAVDHASLRTEGRFRRLNLGLTRYQNLAGNFSLFARLHGQWASKNLDSSESLSLGGPYGLRGWPVSEGQGDSGALSTLELRYRLPLTSGTPGQIQLAGFVDAGRIRINQDDRNAAGTPLFNYNHCSCNSYSLMSAGLGVDWLLARSTISAVWARGLGENPGRNPDTDANSDGEDSKQQLWVQASFRF